MVETKLITDGDVTEECEVVGEYTHYGHELVYVEGDTIEGWIEVEG
jgi:hypothetical protein